jgi:hypothetical protein
MTDDGLPINGHANLPSISERGPTMRGMVAATIGFFGAGVDR